jgi:hypothetical protein
VGWKAEITPINDLGGDLIITDPKGIQMLVNTNLKECRLINEILYLFVNL